MLIIDVFDRDCADTGSPRRDRHSPRSELSVIRQRCESGRPVPQKVSLVWLT